MERPLPCVLITGADFLSLEAHSVRFAGEGKKRRGFATDTEISGSKGMERELTRWVPDEDDLGLGLEMESGAGGWDQFRANEELFGVKTSWNEELYTTKLDKAGGAEQRRREQEAARIAREIEGKAAKNPHLAEERNQKGMEDSGMDEEDRYGAVVREDDRAAGKGSSGAAKTEAKAGPTTNNNNTTNTTSTATSAAASGEQPVKKTTKLNPNAKEFTFNPDAPAFVPPSVAMNPYAEYNPYAQPPPYMMMDLRAAMGGGWVDPNYSMYNAQVAYNKMNQQNIYFGGPTGGAGGGGGGGGGGAADYSAQVMAAAAMAHGSNPAYLRQQQMMAQGQQGAYMGPGQQQMPPPRGGAAGAGASGGQQQQQQQM
jgi:hypothetical protein